MNMNVTVRVQDFPTICRLCLRIGDLQPLEKLDVYDTAKNIANIEILEEDSLPKNVCKNCIKKLMTISMFISKLKNYNMFLKTILLLEQNKTQLSNNANNATLKYTFQGNDDKYTIVYDVEKTNMDGGDVSVKTEFVDVESQFGFPVTQTSNVQEPEIVFKTETLDPLLNDSFLETDTNSTQTLCCNRCTEKFPTDKLLIEHVTKRHVLGHEQTLHNVVNQNSKSEVGFGISENILENKMEISDYKIEWDCIYCEKNFTSEKQFSKHIADKHSSEDYKPTSSADLDETRSDEKFTDNETDSALTDLLGDDVKNAEQSLLYASEKILDKIKIEEETVTVTNNVIETHEERVKIEKECRYCKDKFTLDSLKKHIAESHATEEQKRLEYEENKKEKYKVIRSMQVNTPIFICGICNRKFYKRTIYVAHQVVHTGEKPYMCAKCGKRFKQKQTLTNHSKSHEKESFTCDCCGKHFLNKNKLKIHLKQHGFHDIKKRPTRKI